MFTKESNLECRSNCGKLPGCQILRVQQGHASFDWSYFKSKRDVYVKRLNRIYANNLGNDEIEHIQGRASFLNKREVEVKLEDGSKQTIKAKKILIATGGRPTIPAIPGKELFIDSDGFHDLERQLKKVAVSGVEMSEMLHALGSDVRFFIRGEKLLRRFDPMIQDTVMKEDERQGVHLHKGSQVTKVEDLGNSMKKMYYKSGDKETSVEADCILFGCWPSPGGRRSGPRKSWHQA